MEHSSSIRFRHVTWSLLAFSLAGFSCQPERPTKRATADQPSETEEPMAVPTEQPAKGLTAPKPNGEPPTASQPTSREESESLNEKDGRVLKAASRWTVFEVNEAAIGKGLKLTLDIVDDKASGSAGCNGYVTSLHRTGRKLSFGPMKVPRSRKVCSPKAMEVQSDFLRAMQRVSRYEISEARVLTLFGQDTPLLRARLTRKRQ